MSVLSNDDLDAFARVFQSSGWEQVQIRVGDVQLRLSKASAQQTTESVVSARVSRRAGDPHRQRDTSSEDAPSQSAGREIQVFAPHVATFRRSVSAGSRPLVEVGGRVEADSEVCALEVMRVTSGLRAGARGIVKRICVADGSLVEAGQALFTLEALHGSH
ncbi:MAG: biotin carboxyl carrier protein [Gammaproteobacteria bacterium]|nr:biotin carboxyl carrier protein [Gammaproteobacteria bacterium]